MHSAVERRPQPGRACGACGATGAKACHHQRFVVPAGYPLPSAYDIVACQRCGFVYADPPATQREYDRFYCEWSKYDDSATATGSGLSEYDAARLTRTAADIARVLPSRAATILDAGCATGGLLTALHEAGFSAVAGLDPSPRCAAACRERGFQAYAGSIFAPPAHMPKFDCIVFSHVLEHVYDIPAFFDAARALLSPGGYLYIETPDATRYAHYLYAPFQEFNTEHINHFSPQALKTTARRFGFEPLTVEQKVLRTGKDMDYPAVFGVFRDSSIRIHDSVASRDYDLPERINDYIRRSAELMQSINRHLETELADTKSVILWGAGQLTMKLLTLPCFADTAIRALVDNNPVLRGKRLANAPILSPGEIAGASEPIVIATLLHADEIASQIRRLDFHNRVIELLPSRSSGVQA
ncbi:MAG: class I SAM-dependent methyltransferase [Terriglobales bacterium]